MKPSVVRNSSTKENRFLAAAVRVRELHGGDPKATIEDGRIVFTYPDGTKTSGGRVINGGVR